MPETATKFFNAKMKGEKIKLLFAKNHVANVFAQMELCSRILHSLKPDDGRVWRESPRLTVEIRGWPKLLIWNRRSALKFEGSVFNVPDFNLAKYVEVLEAALKGMIVGQKTPSGKKVFVFQIGYDGEWLEYRFYTKARTVVALCVLYDLEAHSRNDLELNIPKKIGLKKWPKSSSGDSVRTYGDPSKTADVLRNEGWPRDGANSGMEVFRQTVGGAKQQMYRLLRKEQSMTSQVMRSNILPRWRIELFKSQDHRCRICHNQYPVKYLEPDHRIPVIVAADELTEENYKEKLMTLCRYCNQQKREACKVLPPDYDWINSPWAYPEKFEIQKIRKEIERYIEVNGITISDAWDLVKEGL